MGNTEMRQLAEQQAQLERLAAARGGGRRQSTSDIVINGRFQISKKALLGEGGFGKVYKGIDAKTGNLVAAKEITVEVDEERGRDAMQEIMLFKQMDDHPNLVRMFDFGMKGSAFWIIMDFCDQGDLQEYHKKNKPELKAQVFMMKQIATAVAHMHNMHTPIVHRDLKPQNILVQSTPGGILVKLTDFGLSKCKDKQMEKMDETFLMSTMGGTPAYIAPEILMRQKYSSSVDVFSLGLVFLAMIRYKENQLILIPLHEGQKLTVKGLTTVGLQMSIELQMGARAHKELVRVQAGDSAVMKSVKQVILKAAKPLSDDRPRATEVQKDLEQICDQMSDGQLQQRNPPSRESAESREKERIRQQMEELKMQQQMLRLVQESQEKKQGGLLGDGAGGHLAALLAAQALFASDSDEEDDPTKISKGDKVIVEKDEERAKDLQKNSGGWNDRMRKYLDREGTVKQFSRRQNIAKVEFPDGQAWSYNADLLTKTNQGGAGIGNGRVVDTQDRVSMLFKRYDVVKIPEEEDLVKALQTKEHGGWNDKMRLCLGSKGIVSKVDKDGDVYVEFINGHKWALNPELLVKVNTSESKVKEGDMVLIKDDRKGVMELQAGHGGFVKPMEECLGQTGVIQKCLKQGIVKVKVGKQSWTFNEKALTLIASKDEMMSAVMDRMKAE